MEVSGWLTERYWIQKTIGTGTIRTGIAAEHLRRAPTGGEGGPGDGGQGGLGPAGPGQPPPTPAFQAANYVFSVDSIEILNTRSHHQDSNKASISVSIGNNGQPQTIVKDLGDQNNGHFPVGLSIGPLNVSSPDIGIAFNYQVINSGHQNWDDIQKKLTTTGQAAATAGAAAATAAIGGTAVGAALGTAVLPVIGTALGIAAAWIVSNIVGLLFANCDGPVAFEQIALKGSEIWVRTMNGPYSHVTYHPGLDSPSGCGSNSKYNVYWTIRRQ